MLKQILLNNYFLANTKCNKYAHDLKNGWHCDERALDNIDAYLDTQTPEEHHDSISITKKKRTERKKLRSK